MEANGKPWIYNVPTPAWFHSWGLDYEGNLRRGDELTTRKHVTLLERLPESRPLWEVRNEMQKGDPPAPEARIVLDVEDPTFHGGCWQTQKESQNIGLFADPLRHPTCKLRSWPKNYSFV
ncbi:uncharacterized protein LOC131931974 [Physella acuta]|uniref:uncharacterized protein LOC131931974 n=1 Tax=Physella acuta TaxID=109671 RepID=UPI0027DD6B7E|nr:uncharacterized protein LOC131931974 [Physella acuta]